MRPLPSEYGELTSRHPTKKASPKVSYKSIRLTPEQLKTKKVAKRLEHYACNPSRYSPEEIGNLIRDVHGSVIRLKIEGRTLRQSFHNKRPKKRK